MSEVGRDEHEDFIRTVGEAATHLGPSGGDKTKLGNEFKNVLSAVEKDRVLSYKDGTKAMRMIADQAAQIKTSGGKP